MNATRDSRIMEWANAALAFIYPNVCQICEEAQAGKPDGFVCSGCRQQARFIAPPYCDRCGLPFEGDITNPFECGNCRDMKLHFRSARSAVVASGVVLEAIHRYKYQRALWFEPFLANLLVQRARSELLRDRWDCIVPVPLHTTKQREREFNQAERLAARFSAAMGIPIEPHILKRVLPTRTQTLLTRQERAANMRNAFALRRPVKLNGKRIILFDDVFTTGATTNACAKILRAAGAEEVCVWTVARGL